MNSMMHARFAGGSAGACGCGQARVIAGIAALPRHAFLTKPPHLSRHQVVQGLIDEYRASEKASYADWDASEMAGRGGR